MLCLLLICSHIDVFTVNYFQLIFYWFQKCIPILRCIALWQDLKINNQILSSILLAGHGQNIFHNVYISQCIFSENHQIYFKILIQFLNLPYVKYLILTCTMLYLNECKFILINMSSQRNQNIINQQYLIKFQVNMIPGQLHHLLPIVI